MSDEPAIRNDHPPFGGEFDQEHRRVDPCFMTGKGCVYTDIIDRTIKDRKLKGGTGKERDYLGFSVMPFRKNLDTFFKNCLEPYFEGAYDSKVTLQRADEVRRPGIIICEGICKRIQESDFVTVDVSVPNANVFYELGLAYGMGHKIVVIHHHDAEFGKTMAKDLQGMGCHPFAYHDLDPIKKGDIDREDNVWRNAAINSEMGPANPRMLFYEHHLNVDAPVKNVPEEDTTQTLLRKLLGGPEPDRKDQADIRLDFGIHVRSGVGLAIAKLCKDLEEGKEAEPATQTYQKIIEGFKVVLPVKTHRYIIVLNGVSGPATFALTHVLTGGVTKEFVSYGDAFDPEAESEKILYQILDGIADRKFDSVECIINVKVGRSRNDEERLAVNTSDWRRILSWELNKAARRQQPIKIMS